MARTGVTLYNFDPSVSPPVEGKLLMVPPTDLNEDRTVTFPSDGGSAGQFLQSSDGEGTLVWATPSHAAFTVNAPVALTGPATITDVQAVYQYTAAAAQTVNLPAITAALDGATLFIKIGSPSPGAITVDPDGSQTIDGAATKNLSANDSLMLIADNTAGNWIVV